MPDPEPPMTASAALADAFLAWLDSSEQDWFWRFVTRKILRAWAEPIRPIIDIVPILGPFGEQPVALPDRSQTLVSSRKGRLILMFALGSSQQVTLSVAFRDRRGNPARVDGVPEWMTDNSEVLALEPGADGLSCLVKAVGPLGKASVTLSADADLGTGTTPIVGTFAIEVTAGSATVVTLEPGKPEEQPEEQPEEVATGGGPGDETGVQIGDELPIDDEGTAGSGTDAGTGDAATDLGGDATGATGTGGSTSTEETVAPTDSTTTDNTTTEGAGTGSLFPGDTGSDNPAL